MKKRAAERKRMNETLLKILAVVVLFAGEFFSIYSEMLAARSAKTHTLTLAILAPIVLWMCFAGLLLLAGYFLGYLSARNIWVVTVTSLGSILIAEPLLIVFMFGEWPTLGAWIGLIFAVLGMIAAFVF